MNDLERGLSGLGGYLNGLGRALGGLGGYLSGLGSALGELGSSLEDLGSALEGLGSALEDLGGALEGLGSYLNELGGALDLLGAALGGLGNSWVSWRGTVDVSGKVEDWREGKGLGDDGIVVESGDIAAAFSGEGDEKEGTGLADVTLKGRGDGDVLEDRFP